MAVRFEWHRSVEKKIIRLPEVGAALELAVRYVAEEATRLAESSRYREGIDGEVGDNEDGDLVGRVNAFWWASGFIEFGTSQRRAEAPLRQALDSGAVKRAL